MRGAAVLLLVALGGSACFEAIRPINVHTVTRPQFTQLGSRRGQVPSAQQSEASGVPLVPDPDLAASAPVTQATIFASVTNVIKNIVGSGVLALPAGIAAFSSSPSAVLPAFLCAATLATISAYTFKRTALLTAETRSTTYTDIWTNYFGQASSILPAFIVFAKTYTGCLAYAIIIGDSLSSIATLMGAPAALTVPNIWIWIISICVLTPLCLLRDLSALAFGSAIGCGGTIYCAGFMVKRWLDGSYQVGGKFHNAIAQASRPVFAAPTAARPLLNVNIFVLVAMLSTAFLAHYNAPRFYNELNRKTEAESQKAFTKTTILGFSLSVVIAGLILAFGYLTFGGASQGLILNNYATADPLAILARIGVAFSVIFSYPVLFLGMRDCFFGLIPNGAESSKKPRVHALVTFALLGLCNGLALFCKDLGLVISLGGAVLGTSLAYIMPGMMSAAAIRRKGKALKKSGKSLSRKESFEGYANMGIAALGSLLLGLGSYMSLKNA